jgi:hypothetical protein
MSGYEIPGIETEALGPIIRKSPDDDALLAQIAATLNSQSA